MLGHFFRPGTLDTQAVRTTLDDDWPSLAAAVILRHGVYFLKRNHGFVTLGSSDDTSEFAGDSLRWWWHSSGRQDYPRASSWLLLCDGGSSNRSNTWLFKAELAKLVPETGGEVRGARDPPSTSKYNPIEHRRLPHLRRACQGVILISVGLVPELMAPTSTKTGLRVSVQTTEKV